MKNASDQSLQYLLFSVGDKTCAIEMTDLLEVTAAVPVTPLPFVPKCVDGLVNVAGQIMPQVNAMRLLDETEQGLKTVLILNINTVRVALCVTQILQSLTLESGQILPLEKPQAYFKAYIMRGQEFVWLLDLQALASLLKASPKAQSDKAGFLGKVSHNKAVIEKHSDFFLFQMGKKRYAFHLQQVDEIVEIEQLYHQPRAPEIIAGVNLLRGEPRLMLDLSKILKQDSTVQRQVAVMTELETAYIGLVVDHLLGIESIKQADIRGEGALQSIRCNDAKVATVLDIQSLLKPQLTAIAPFIPASTKQDRRKAVKQVELLRFSLQGDRYAIEVPYIRRIINEKRIEPLLSPKAWILGTTDIEGKIVPVVDLMSQLGYSHHEKLKEFVVVHDGQSEWALAIPACEEIIHVDEPSLDKIDDEIKAYVSALVNVNDQLVTILNPISLCLDNKNRQVG